MHFTTWWPISCRFVCNRQLTPPVVVCLCGQYAEYLCSRGLLQESEEYYLKALKQDPYHADNLGR
jgi:hypothetical protein